MSVAAANRQNARSIRVVCAATPEDEQVMLENMQRPLVHNKLNTKSASRWFYYTDVMICTVKTLSE
jgi:hypothetical protein